MQSFGDGPGYSQNPHGPVGLKTALQAGRMLCSNSRRYRVKLAGCRGDSLTRPLLSTYCVPGAGDKYRALGGCVREGC